jgi:hypothetical protein
MGQTGCKSLLAVSRAVSLGNRAWWRFRRALLGGMLSDQLTFLS